MARLSGVSEPTLARARDGGPITGATAARIALALKTQKPIPELVELYKQHAA